MHGPPPPHVDVGQLRSRLAEHWGVEADHLDHLPKGGGAHHWIASTEGRPAAFVTVDDLGTKPWIADTADATFAGLAEAYATAARLRQGARLDFVVDPVPTADGSVVVRLDERHAMAVFPLVEGDPGEWGDPLTADLRAELLVVLASLHAVEGAPAALLAPRRPRFAERTILASAITAAGAGVRWTGGPWSERAREAVAEHAGDLGARLARLDHLASRLPDDRQALVVTHGEPHPGNLIATDGGLRLIDWDTVALAVPERDLWMLDDGSPAPFAAYEAATGHHVDPAALEHYRLTWTLSDLAYLLDLFRSPHGEIDDVDRKWDALLRLLAGGSSRPYAAVA